jgi:signal transduction histidine kinase
MASAGVTLWPGALVLLTGAAAIVWPAARRPRWLTPATRTAIPAVASLAWTATGLAGAPGTTHGPSVFGPGEATLLLCLHLIAIRSCPARWVVTCALLTSASLMALPLRIAQLQSTPISIAACAAALAVMAAITAGIGSNLRSLDQHSRHLAATTRRAEQVALAADVHDRVTHQITGMLVQTQVARMLPPTEPGRLGPVLEDIETAAAEALTSLRRVVALLDDTDHRRVRGQDGGLSDGQADRPLCT